MEQRRGNRGDDRRDGRGTGGARGSRGGNPRRDGRAREAARHIADMDARFAKEIAASLAGVREFDGLPKAAQKAAVKVEAAAEGAATSAGAEDAKAEDAAAKGAEEPVYAVADASEAVPESGSADDAGTALEAQVPAPEAHAPAPALPQVSVVDEDSVAAIIARGRGRAQFCDLAVLDFASFTQPGGGYERGAWAQEEALCAESFLYNVLAQRKDWYGENRRRKINCELYTDRGLVVPAVRFTRGKVHAYADVIVVAAPNARRARDEYKVSEDALLRAMRGRIRLAFSIADGLGHDKLVLGAFGCGAFGWDAETVAELFRQELAAGGHVATQVVFAIPATRYDENLPKFQHAFSAFPAGPAESYAAASAKRAEAAEARAAQDADDDDDDWRKYL